MPSASWHGADIARALTVLLCGAIASSGSHQAEAATPRPVTFNRDVAPILFANCTSCHRAGEAAPFELLTYEDARRRARQIIEVTERGLMPPWQPDPGYGEFEGERRLAPSELETLKRWVADGALEGDARDRPAPPTFTPGWQLGRPDLVVAMAEAYEVPAEGTDVFRNFVLPIPLETRRLVAAVEFRPGNPRVLHHARILIDDTREGRHRDAHDSEAGFGGMDAPGARFPDGHFLGWAPGKMPAREALPWTLEPGQDLVIQMHLKPTGRPEPVQASVGLYFTNKAPADLPVMLRMGSQTIDIPAGHPAYEVVDSYTLPVDVRALRIYPHAHYLGKEMTVTARRPDGSTEGLLHIRDWDFNWQDEYEYAKPVELPRGTTLTMHYTYDNSAANPRNPHSPPQRVHTGPGTSDEMGELLLQLLPKERGDLGALRAHVRRKTLLMETAGDEYRLEVGPDSSANHNVLGVHYVQLGQPDRGIEQFRLALSLDPAHAVAHYNLALVLIGRGQLEEAHAHLEAALAARPQYAEAHTNLGVALERMGQPDAALAHYQAALESRPEHAAALANLGRLEMARGSAGEAINAFERLQKLQPGNPSLLDALAAAYAATGRQELAARTALQAFRLALDLEDDELARAIRLRMESYQAPVE